jgi:elongation factor Ts
LTITVEQIKALRELTGAGIMDCKRALEQAGGDLEGAQRVLREMGVASAAKKASRETNEGLVESYIHSGGRIGALVELNCETDFVARTDDLKDLAHNIAMQVAAMSPIYVDEGDIPDDDDQNPQEVCLLQQAFIRDQSITIQDLLGEAIGKIGENIRVRRFARFALGE